MNRSRGHERRQHRRVCRQVVPCTPHYHSKFTKDLYNDIAMAGASSKGDLVLEAGDTLLLHGAAPPPLPRPAWRPGRWMQTVSSGLFRRLHRQRQWRSRSGSSKGFCDPWVRVSAISEGWLRSDEDGGTIHFYVHRSSRFHQLCCNQAPFIGWAGCLWPAR